MWLRHSVGGLFAACAAISCSGPQIGPQAEPVSEARLAPAVTARFCIRGSAAIGQSPSGTISSTDCNDSAGYYETYLVTVSGPREVTFAVDSDFDSFLALVRVAEFSDTDYTGTLLGHDDDSNGGRNARLAMHLEPGVTYAVMVSGLKHSELGRYTLTVR